MDKELIDLLLLFILFKKLNGIHTYKLIQIFILIKFIHNKWLSP